MYNFIIIELFFYLYVLVKLWDEMKIGFSKGILFFLIFIFFFNIKILRLCFMFILE